MNTFATWAAVTLVVATVAKVWAVLALAWYRRL